jgi:DHA3 family macrolide efflux protein-like MFS transporter
LNRTALKNMILLIQGQLVTNMGGQIYDVALLLWLKELTGSAALMGLALLATNLPEALLAPLGGKIADRRGGVATMVGADLGAGVVLCGVLGAVLLGAGTGTTVAVLCLGNILLGVCGSCFAPAVTSLVPRLVERRHLARANSAQQFGRVGGRLLGQGLGGFVFTTLGPVGALALNAGSFLASALSESFIRVDPRKGRGPASEEKNPADQISAGTAPADPVPTEEDPGLLRETREALALVWRNRELRVLTSYIGFFHLAMSCLPISLPFYAEHILGLEPVWLGFLIAAYTVGILVGFGIMGTLPVRMARTSLITLAASLVGLLFLGLGAVSGFAAAVTILVLIGTGIGVIVVNLMTELQILAPETDRGGVMGAAHAVGGASLPLGMALTGVLIDSFHGLGLGHGTIVRGLLIAAGAGSLALLCIRPGRGRSRG